MPSAADMRGHACSRKCLHATHPSNAFRRISAMVWQKLELRDKFHIFRFMRLFVACYI